MIIDHLKNDGFLNNMSFPRNLYQFKRNMELDEYFNTLDIIENTDVGWTVDKNAKVGDISFFMQTTSAIENINNIENEILKIKDAKEKEYLQKCLNKGKELYNLYGGKIFAIGVVVEEPFTEKNEDRDYIHWTSRTYAHIEIIEVLDNPVDKEEFKEITHIEPKGAITKLSNEKCKKILEIISKHNDIEKIIPFLKSFNK